MEGSIDIINGIGRFFIAFISGIFGFLLVVLLILICLKKEKRESVVKEFVLIIYALRGKGKL